MRVAESLEKMAEYKPEVKLMFSKGQLQEIKISGNVNLTMEEIN